MHMNMTHFWLTLVKTATCYLVEDGAILVAQVTGGNGVETFVHIWEQEILVSADIQNRSYVIS